MQFLRRLAQSFKIRFATTLSLFRFLWMNKMWWLIPMIFVLVIFFAILLFAQSTPLGPFIYTLF